LIFVHVKGIINRPSISFQVQKHTDLKIYNTLASRALLYGSETWAIREQNRSRMTSAEMKFVEERGKNTRGKITKPMKILTSELKINSIVKKFQSY